MPECTSYFMNRRRESASQGFRTNFHPSSIVCPADMQEARHVGAEAVEVLRKAPATQSLHTVSKGMTKHQDSGLILCRTLHHVQLWLCIKELAVREVG